MSSAPPGEPGHGTGEHAKTGPSDPIYELLKSSRTIAVVGLSSRKFRPSFGVAEYMQLAGYGSFL